MPIPVEEQLAEAGNATASTDKPVKELVEEVQDLSLAAGSSGAGGVVREETQDQDQGESGSEGDDGEPGVSVDTEKKKKKKKKSKGKGKASKVVEKLKELAQPAVPDALIDQIRQQIKMEQGTDEGIADDDIRKALKTTELIKILEGRMALGDKSNTKDIGEHKFWKTQPVPQGPLVSTSSSAPGQIAQVSEIEEGPIDPPKTIDDVRKEPLPLPKGYEWCTIDVTDVEELSEVTTLLSENYIEDDDASYRLHYSKPFLDWALKPPGYFEDWHVGVRVSSNKKLVAFISGIPLDIRVRKNHLKTAEINFLCVHKKLRSKRLAPVLIKEITRRVNLKGIWQAVYTAGVVIPTPIGTCRYYHRSINLPKLVDIGFTPLAHGDTVARAVRRNALPPVTQIPGLREMTKADIPAVVSLMTKYMDRFELAQSFSNEDDAEHWFLSGQGEGPWNPGEGEGHKNQVVWAYVVEDPTTQTITDFVSFYSLSSLIVKDPKHSDLRTAYLYYYASDVILGASASTDDHVQLKLKLAARLNELVKDCLIIAKECGFDVFNALSSLDNNLFLQEQLFGLGVGFLNYYLYNWRCNPINGSVAGARTKETSGIGLVML